LTTLLTWDVGTVFCEKPLTDDIERSRRIVEAYRAQNRRLAVNYLRRWETSARQVKDEIAEGVWGALLSGHGLYTKGIYANGSHLIDLAQYLLGPLEAQQATSWLIDHQPDDPTIAGRLATGDCAPVTLAIGDARLYSVFELDLLFEKGRITFGDSGWTLCRRRAVADRRFSGYTSLEPATWKPTSMDDTMRLAVADLHAIAGTPRQPPSTGETALAAQEVCRRLHDLMKGECRE
jgi:predicted dehydrogenase